MTERSLHCRTVPSLLGTAAAPLQTFSGHPEQLCASKHCQNFFTTAVRHKRLPQHTCAVSALLQETSAVRTNLAHRERAAQKRTCGKRHHPTVASLQSPTQDPFPFFCYFQGLLLQSLLWLPANTQIPLIFWLWLLSVQKPAIQQSPSKLVVDHPPKSWGFLHNSFFHLSLKWGTGNKV